MALLSAAAAVLFSVSGIFPAGPSTVVFRSREFGGKARENVVVKSMGGRLRLEAFGSTFIFDGKSWTPDPALVDENCGASAFLALYLPQPDLKPDSLGRPLLLLGVPAGRRRARVEYRYDAVGLATANLVLSDGSGYQFRRASVESLPLSSSEFEPPKYVDPVRSSRYLGATVTPDWAAADFLLALDLDRAEQAQFDLAFPPPRPTAVRRAAPAPAGSVAPAEPRSGREAAAILFAREPLTQDARLLRYVNLVGRRAASGGIANPNRFRFAVTQTDVPYAAALPSGVIVVSRGLLFLLECEAELAVVLAREVCRSESGQPGGAPETAVEAGDLSVELRLDRCGASLSAAAGYDVSSYGRLLGALADRSASARDGMDLRARAEKFKALPEFTRGGKALAERFRASAIM
jgi:hypothetical protein